MKTKVLGVLLLTFLLFSVNVFAKDAITKTTFTVSGNCEMCKERIENAAKVKGVVKASWDEETHVLTVAYAPIKISLDEIQQNIANAGYDTEKFTAEKEAYNKLPQCCQYSGKK